MPAMSIYLNQKKMDEILVKSKSSQKSVSQIISDAIDMFLKDKERVAASKDFIKFLQTKKPLTGGSNWKQAWEEVHKEREEDDADRN